MLRLLGKLVFYLMLHFTTSWVPPTFLYIFGIDLWAYGLNMLLPSFYLFSNYSSPSMALDMFLLLFGNLHLSRCLHGFMYSSSSFILSNDVLFSLFFSLALYNSSVIFCLKLLMSYLSSAMPFSTFASFNGKRYGYHF